MCDGSVEWMSGAGDIWFFENYPDHYFDLKNMEARLRITLTHLNGQTPSVKSG